MVCAILVLWGGTVFGAIPALQTVSTVQSNGVLYGPTNFFNANAGALGAVFTNYFSNFSAVISDQGTNVLSTYLAPSWNRVAASLQQQDNALGPSGQFMLLSIGDSVATENSSALAQSLFPLIYRRHGRQGVENAYANASHRAFFLGTVQSMLPDAFWFGGYYALSSGSSVTWSNDLNSSGNFVNRVSLYWIQHPGGGAFRLQQSAAGGAYTDIAALSGFNATVRGAYTNLTFAQNYCKFRVASDSSTNYVIMMGDRYAGLSSGFISGNMAYPGIGLANITNVPHAIRDVVLTNFFKDTGGGMILLHMKEDTSVATDLGLREVNQWINLTTNLNVAAVWVGTPAVSTDTSTVPVWTRAQDALIRSNAEVANISYFDAYKYCGDYAVMQANGLSLDGVHPTAAANALMAQGFMTEFGMNDLITANANWKTYTYTAFDYHGTDQTIPFTVTYGNSGGNYQTVIADGIRFTGTAGADNDIAFLGDASTTYINIPAAGSSILFQVAGLSRALGKAYLSGGWYLGAAGTDPGIGNLVVDKGFGVAGFTATKTGTYTATVADWFIPCDTTSGFTVTLPATPNTGQIITLKKITADGNTLTIGSNGKNIDGAASKTITSQWGQYTLYYNGTTWYVLTSGVMN